MVIKTLLQKLGWTQLDDLAELFQTGLKVLLIIVLAWLLYRLASRTIGLARHYMLQADGGGEQQKRVETLARVGHYVAAVAIIGTAAILVLGELGISIAPLLASAGVAGLVLGFGAQSLIKDYFNGFVLLLENQVRQGDVVEVAGKSGLVEEVTLRYIRLRDYDGNVHFIPNGTVTTVTNRSREFAFAVMDVSIAYGEDADRVFPILREVAVELRQDAVFGPRIKEDLEVAGMDQWAESAVVLRCRFKVEPLAQWDVRREYLRRLKRRFDAEGIEIPFRHLKLVVPPEALPATRPEPTGK